MNLLYARTEAFLSVLISQNLLVWEVSKIVMRTSPIRYIFLGAGEIELRGTFLAKQEGKASQSGGEEEKPEVQFSTATASVLRIQQEKVGSRKKNFT